LGSGPTDVARIGVTEEIDVEAAVGEGLKSDDPLVRGLDRAGSKPKRAETTGVTNCCGELRSG
jgi:hypothetical protein